MPAEKTTAIVLRVIEFSETSAVVTLFSRDFGKIGGLAKGARRLKGPFESALDLLAICRIVLIRKSSETLDLLTEAKLERRFRGTDRGLPNLYAGYYVAELLSELTDLGDPHPALFDAALAALVELGSTSSAARVILRFELTLLRLLGHLPLLEMCAECGNPVEIAGRVPFGMLSGGILCRDCRPGRPHVVQVSGSVLKTMSAFAESDDRWRDWPLGRETSGELRAVLNYYLSHLLGHKPRMHPYLGAIAEAI